ncbi:putative harbinger transposase-derived nuclease [Abeliophyllum distichum]|uniref:Harbinger transposase-derived nuclease n=1 Tax=Abeliophyllum distichum TaxID=126358 RepID=A0ABD1SWB9_9LAMI
MVIQAIVIYDGIRRRARHLPRAPHRNWDIEREMTFTRIFGAIDGTHIAAKVPVDDQARYRNRKQVISQNVLVACTFDMKFTYVLVSWEGSAHDGRLLRSAILRQGHKLTIPVGKYYLADAGFSLVPGFLSSYRRTRYHRRDIEGQRPENRKELFNFWHSSIRNFVERTIDDVCEEDFDSSDDEVNPTHADVPEEVTINAHISFTVEASWSNNRDAIAQSMWVNHNPNADADIDFH